MSICNYSDEAKFNLILNKLIKAKKDFMMQYKGTRKTIIFNKNKFNYTKVSLKDNEGYHLCKMVEKDVLKFIEKNKDTYDWSLFNYQDQYINAKGISNFINAHKNHPVFTMVDITTCYYRTAYLLGFITKRTYLQGVKVKEWKKGRNASIGSLIARVRTYYYKEGVRINDKPDLSKEDDYKIAVRNHIIYHVYLIFKEIEELIKDDVLMYLSDSWAVPQLKARQVMQIINKYNYEYTVEPCRFIQIDVTKKRVEWLNFDKNPYFNNTVKFKYFYYSDRLTKKLYD